MRRFLIYLTLTAAMMMLGSAALAGQTENIDLDCESGRVEIFVTIDPPDGPPVAASRWFDVVQSTGGSFCLLEGTANGGGSFDLFHFFDDTPLTTLGISTDMCAGQADFGYTVSVRVQTIQPIILRLLDEVEFNLPAEAFLLEPITGMITDNLMCPGMYSLTFDHTLELPEFEFDALRSEQMELRLTDTLGEARFACAGSLSVSGNSEDDQGNEDSAFAEGTIDDGGFEAGGCTSSGLVDGDAQASGEILDQGNGSYTVTVTADAFAAQPVGYAGSCFIGVFGNGIILSLEQPKTFSMINTGSGSVSFTPTTGSIVDDTLSPGRYAIDFDASATIGAGQTMASGSINWTLELRAPGCNAADVAPPIGSLDFSDVIAFLAAYGSSEAAADLAPPIGVWDFTDVLAFLVAFGTGCP